MNLIIKILFLFMALLGIASCTKNNIEADILIINGTVYNGTDTVSNKVSIAIKSDKIVFIGDENTVDINAKKLIDAKGLIVCPGFIDPHTHAESDVVDATKSHNLPFLMQGVTTVTIGNDGSSYFPIHDFKKKYNKNGIGTNLILLVGHGTIREEVMGKSDKKATEKDIIDMKKLIQQEMDDGAFGMSTGLYYAPGSYSNTEEVIALAKTVSKNDGIYDTHLRDESSFSIGLIPAIEEAIEIGHQAKLHIHISHIKCLGVDVWHQSDSIIHIIEDAQKQGIEVTANQYPYDASATSLKAAVVPRWAESGGLDSLFIRYDQSTLKKQILAETKNNIKRRGGSNKLLIVKAEDNRFVGKNLSDISQLVDMSPEATVFKILRTGKVKVASFNMNQEDVSNFMQQKWVVTGSDGGSGHPRKYGSFPKKYRKYVKQEKIISVGTFINNSSSKTAEIFKIANRGKLKVGYYADVIVFNPNTFRDKANYTDAFQYAEGLAYSIINGQISVENSKYTKILNGKVLTKAASTKQ